MCLTVSEYWSAQHGEMSNNAGDTTNKATATYIGAPEEGTSKVVTKTEPADIKLLRPLK